MTIDQARRVFRQKVKATGIVNPDQKREKDYLSVFGSKYIVMMCSNSYAGPNPPTLIADPVTRRVVIIKETVKLGNHSKSTVASKTHRLLARMKRQFGPYSRHVKGYWGGYIWKKDNYRVAMHYQNMSGFARCVIYRTKKQYFKKTSP